MPTKIRNTHHSHHAGSAASSRGRRVLLIATPRRDELESLRTALTGQWRIVSCTNPGELAAMNLAGPCFAVLVDAEFLHRLAGETDAMAEASETCGSSEAGLHALWKRFPNASVVIMAGSGDMREVVATVKKGADNYLTYPIHPDEVRYVLESLEAADRMEGELSYLRDSFWGEDVKRLTRTESPAMREVLAKAKAAAPTSALILLTGESGTGKSALAKLIHTHSMRKDKPFVAVHCGAIPETLVESELFGHEKGAFTGAVRRKLGKFEIAHGGTIFLDEVGTLSMAAQVKLLQVLQEKTFHRVGGETDIHTDARVIAAANQDLKAMVREGRFREDLYYRLNVFPLEIPPLRERKEDIPLLVSGFLERLSGEYGKGVYGATPVTLDALAQYDWPGNVRELENLVERAYILSGSRMLTLEHFPAEFHPAHGGYASPAQRIAGAGMTLAEAREHAKDALEKQYLHDVLTLHHGRINKTAAHAGITTRQLNKLMTRHGLDKNAFK
ncbi:sigma-54-dependent transcriptional regulator [Oceanidesulfovibrio marinus]|uniref:sigma-54-dependent transcriptional regulator n=1 Tax=Oceanidesulfovibrio marinus TaxID=370038 RepID=UPI001F18C9E7|nr:sigma-54 dependent transcriptional regulator [Oceanidesulfovibrio marinus]